MDKQQAISSINKIFSQYRSLLPEDHKTLNALKYGKVYELYVLAELLKDLQNRGFVIQLASGTTLKFKGSPGKVNPNETHFRVTAPNTPHRSEFWVFVNIEFQTLGSTLTPIADNSRLHELDIAVTSTECSPYPDISEIAMGIECKSTAAGFEKSLVREALGLRRELSFLGPPQRSLLSIPGTKRHVSVPACPPIELWLAYCDPKGNKYKGSPAVFGVELRHIKP